MRIEGKHTLVSPQPALDDKKSSGGGFDEALGAIESTAKGADQAADQLVAGEIDIHDAMVQMEKADLMLKLGTTVRNKLVDAYQQLMASAGG